MLLAFDTATSAVTVALVDGGTVLAASDVVAHNRQGELLAPGIDAVLRAAGVPVDRLDEVVVGVGPGPFTGLRVGVAAARALAHALGVPAHGVCSLDAVGTGARAVVTDARRREVYWAVYDGAGRRLAGPAVGAPDVVAAALRERGVARLVGAGAELYRDRFDGLAVEAPPYPSAALLAAVAERLPPVPLYLRRPDAAEPAARKPALR